MIAPGWLCHNQAILTEAEFAFNGSLAELARLADETRRFCQENSLASEVEFDLNLALEELFTNSLNHGGCAGLHNAVWIRLQLADGDVRVEFCDRGNFFDPDAAPAIDLTAPLERRQAGGLGIHLVRQIVRDLQYQRRGEWNRITMRLPGKSSGRPGHPEG